MRREMPFLSLPIKKQIVMMGGQSGLTDRYGSDIIMKVKEPWLPISLKAEEDRQYASAVGAQR